MEIKLIGFFRLIKNFLRFFLKLFGLKLTTYQNPIYAKIIDDLNISLVLDVGANVGGFANSLINSGYKNRIISFEPVKIVMKN